MTITGGSALLNNLEDVRTRISAACERARRDPRSVRFVAVTKYAAPEWVRELIGEGERDLGESKPQQLVARAEEFAAVTPAIRWHQIGTLQRNKVRKVLPAVDLIHSVDSPRLLEAIDRVAAEEELRPRILLQVNLSREDSKHGFDAKDLPAQWSSLTARKHVEIAGLMTMAAYTPEPEAARPVFRQLRELRDRLAEIGPFDLPDLSMGMSGDFEVAIEEGATLVRIGSRLFEGAGA